MRRRSRRGRRLVSLHHLLFNLFESQDFAVGIGGVVHLDLRHLCFNLVQALDLISWWRSPRGPRLGDWRSGFRNVRYLSTSSERIPDLHALPAMPHVGVDCWGMSHRFSKDCEAAGGLLPDAPADTGLGLVAGLVVSAEELSV